MSDLVVTVPKWFWPEWIVEGDAAGEPETGQEYEFNFSGGRKPNIKPGERLYIVAHGRLRGWAPVVRLEQRGNGWAIIRGGGAVAVTINEPIRGFQGWRHRWWKREDEKDFPDWKTEGVTA